MVVAFWSAIGRSSFVKPREKFIIADVPRPAFGLLYRFELKLNNVMLNLFSQRMDWLLPKQSHSTAVPDLRQLIFSDYLREVAPKAVTIRNTVG